MKLAFMKQRKGESIRIMSNDDVLVTIVYCLMLQKMSVPGILPSISTRVLIELNMILAKEMTICRIGRFFSESTQTFTKLSTF